MGKLKWESLGGVLEEFRRLSVPQVSSRKKDWTRLVCGVVEQSRQSFQHNGGIMSKDPERTLPLFD